MVATGDDFSLTIVRQEIDLYVDVWFKKFVAANPCKEVHLGRGLEEYQVYGRLNGQRVGGKFLASTLQSAEAMFLARYPRAKLEAPQDFYLPLIKKQKLEAKKKKMEERLRVKTTAREQKRAMHRLLANEEGCTW